jgi:hypothetical protein
MRPCPVWPVRRGGLAAARRLMRLSRIGAWPRQDVDGVEHVSGKHDYARACRSSNMAYL